MEVKRDLDKAKVPDGGCGWVVCGAGSMCDMFYAGMEFSYGVLLTPLVERFGTTTSVVSLAGSLMGVNNFLFGMVVPMSIDTIGHQMTAVIGSTMVAIAMLGCVFVKNVYLFLLLYGITAGIGESICSVSIYLILNTYFEKKQSIASSIFMAVVSCGPIWVAPSVNKTLKTFGIQGVFTFYFSLSIISLCLTYFMKPYKRGPEGDTNYHKDGRLSKEEKIDMAEQIKDALKILNSKSKTLKSCPLPNLAYVDFLTNKEFVLMLICASSFYMATSTFTVHVVNMIEEFTQPQHEAGRSVPTSIYFVMNCIGRLLPGFFVDLGGFEPQVVSSACLFVSSLTFLLMPQITNVHLLRFFVGLVGLCFGPVTCLKGTILRNVFGVENLPRSYAIWTFVGGAMSLPGAPLGGLIYDKTKTYSLVSYFLAFTTFVSCCSCILSYFIHLINLRNSSPGLSDQVVSNKYKSLPR